MQNPSHLQFYELMFMSKLISTTDLHITNILDPPCDYVLKNQQLKIFNVRHVESGILKTHWSVL